MIESVVYYILLTVFYTCLAYVTLTRGHHLIIAFISLVRRWREELMERNQDMQLILHSRHTIPISVALTPETTLTVQTRQTIESVLNQHYPQFELIVVLDSEGELPEEWAQAYELEQMTHFFSKIIPTKEVERIWRSKLYSNLCVVQKKAGSAADAVNVAANIARYRYFLPIEDGVQLENDALLQLVRPALFNPREIVAVSSLIGREQTPSQNSLTSKLWYFVSQLEIIRTHLFHHLSLLKRGAIVAGLDLVDDASLLVLWRKDLVQQLGGFADGGALEFSIRMDKHFVKTGTSYQVVSMQKQLGMRPSLSNMESYIKEQRRSATQIKTTLKKHRSIMFDKAAKMTGWVTLPLLFLRTYVAPWIEIASVALLLLGALYGFIGWAPLLVLLVIMAGTSLFIGLLALILCQRQAKPLNTRSLATFIGVGLLEYAGLRQLSLLAQTGWIKA